MPTGGGKSLCYQVPAMLLEGVTLVISPLISLMKDQVDSLENAGIPSTYINSSLSDQEIQARLQQAEKGTYQLIYIAPERLESLSFRRLVGQINVSMIAIDEAHCISQWGHDFRPSYLRIKDMLNNLYPRPVIVALTATATKEVTEDICSQLNIEETVVTGFERDNLTFSIIKDEVKREFLLKYIEKTNPARESFTPPQEMRWTSFTGCSLNKAIARQNIMRVCRKRNVPNLKTSLSTMILQSWSRPMHLEWESTKRMSDM